MNLSTMQKIALEYVPDIKVSFYSYQILKLPEILFFIPYNDIKLIEKTISNHSYYGIISNIIVLRKYRNYKLSLVFFHELGHAILHNTGKEKPIKYKNEVAAWHIGIKLLKQYRPITKHDRTWIRYCLQSYKEKK
jgi:hypothetical protein